MIRAGIEAAVAFGTTCIAKVPTMTHVNVLDFMYNPTNRPICFHIK